MYRSIDAKNEAVEIDYELEENGNECIFLKCGHYTNHVNKQCVNAICNNKNKEIINEQEIFYNNLEN